MIVKRALGDSIPYTPESAVAAGDGIVVGTVLGIATRPIAAGVRGDLEIVGEWKMVKTGGGGVTFAAGAKVYFDEANQLAAATSNEGANLLCGVACEAAADAATYVYVRLQPQGS